MSMTKRFLLATIIVLADLATFFLPFSALFLAYILIFNPSWFREFLNNLAGDRPEGADSRP